jgi:hypothetical protein
MLPDFERAAPIGDFWVEPRSRQFAELLLDLEEDRAASGIVVGMLRESEREG